jgi:hypothetical protein
VGPNKCILGKPSEELVSHFFVSCSYFIDVREKVSKDLGIKVSWDKGTLEEKLLDWISD